MLYMYCPSMPYMHVPNIQWIAFGCFCVNNPLTNDTTTLLFMLFGTYTTCINSDDMGTLQYTCTLSISGVPIG